MEERKLVKSGLFSHTVALPKEWIERHHLTKGSTVSFIEENGNLILTPKKGKVVVKEKKELELSIDGIHKQSIIRDIIASYLTNVGTMRLTGTELKKNSEFFKENISRLPGLEVIEETSDSILVRDFINLEELNVPDLIRRADNIIRSLFLDTLECIDTQDTELAEAIRKRDKEINRLASLVYKCLNYITEHPHEGKIHGIESVYIAQVWELNGYLEKIGDEIKRCALIIPQLKYTTKEKKEIESLVRNVESFYVNVMTSLYKGSIQHADEASQNRSEIKKLCEEYLKHSKSILGTALVSKLIYLISFINSISRIVRYISFEKHQVIKGNIITKRPE